MTFAPSDTVAGRHGGLQTRVTVYVPDADLTEKQWEQQAVGTAGKPGLARQLGWRCYHTLRSKGSEPGYPDWTLVRERVVFVELKRERGGRVSDAQRAWIGALLHAGAEAYIARPADLDRLALILSGRARPDGLLRPVEAGVARTALLAATRAEVAA